MVQQEIYLKSNIMLNWIKSNWSGCVISILFFMLIVYLLPERNNKTKTDEVEYTRHLVSDLELEVKYWAIKSELVDSIQSYINKVAPGNDVSALVLFNECEKANVNILFVMAQGIKESHFGTKGLASKTNSIFNVGAFDGLSEGEISKVHKFKHPNQSIRPYLKLLNSRYLVDKTEDDLLKNYVDVNGKRYASYPKYEQELVLIINDIKTNTKIGVLYDKFRKYSSKLNY